MKTARTNRNSTNAIFEPLEGRALMAAGDLDPSFGVAGKFLAADTIGHPVADVAVQADGKLVLVGSQNGDFAITRVNANGTLDRTFGGNGFVRTNFGGAEKDVAHAVAIQPDGKILVAGQSIADFGDDDRAVLVRLNANGSPDVTFDGDGKRILDLKGSSANALAFQPDGKILVAGGMDSGRFNLNDDFVVARLLPNGSADSTFGKTTLNPLDGDKRIGSTTIDFRADTQGEEASMISLAPGGKIVLAGTGGNGFATNSQKLAVTRLNSNGTIDSSFGDGISGTGKSNNLALFADFNGMHVAADGSITVVGDINGNFLTVRLKSTGGLDQAFGGTGHIETNVGGNDSGKTAFVNREGILVAGVSSGKFAMLRFRPNGQLDQTFGQAGKVVTPMGPDDAILTAKPTSDGKILAFGRTGSTARYFATALPKVNVFSLDPNGAERGDNPASLIFTRDIRASFPTRVFFDLGGTATNIADYTGPATTTIFTGGTKLPGGLLTPVTVERVGFVDIPANETTAIVPITVIDDKALEPAETVRAAIRSNANYALGNRLTQQLDIADNDIARVNFQLATNVNAFGYAADLGATFGPRDKAIDPLAPGGLVFGWDVDNTANARDRGLALPGYIYNTFNHMQKPGGGSKWEIAVPNGMYEVKLAAGDPQQTDSVYRMNLENTLALEGTPSGSVRWFERTTRVQVNDGRLTLTNASGAHNNKIAFIEIRSAAPGATAGAVTENLPVRLPPPQPIVGQPIRGGTVFSQLQI